MSVPHERRQSMTTKIKTTYSFRAEAAVDLNHFLGLVRGRASLVYVYPNYCVEILTELDRIKILALMHRVPDGHVMRQTLRQCPLSENRLERDRDVA